MVLTAVLFKFTAIRFIYFSILVILVYFWSNLVIGFCLDSLVIQINRFRDLKSNKIESFLIFNPILWVLSSFWAFLSDLRPFETVRAIKDHSWSFMNVLVSLETDYSLLHDLNFYFLSIPEYKWAKSLNPV